MSSPLAAFEPVPAAASVATHRPVLRAFRSSRFRALIAAIVLVSWLAFLALQLVRVAADPGSQYGTDFSYWYRAAEAVSANLSPYPQRYLDGPVPGLDYGYKYPPAFAQALVPFTTLSRADATTAWVVVQAACAFLAVWLSTVLGGARKTVEHALWCGLAAAAFLPVFSSVFHGNVSAIQAFQVAVVLGAGTLGGVSLTSAVLLKSTPFALVPAALVRGGRQRLALVVSGVALLGLSFALSPGAWFDFIRIQPNLFFGSHPTVLGLQPAGLIAQLLPQLPHLADLTRVLTLVFAAAALVGSLILARRPDGWPAAVTLGVTVALVVPGAIWYHYLAMLLPLAAFAWPRADRLQRWALLAASGGVSIGLVSDPLSTVTAAAMVASILWILAPATKGQSVGVSARMQRATS